MAVGGGPRNPRAAARLLWRHSTDLVQRAPPMVEDPIQFTTFGVLPPGGLWECPQADGRSEGCVPVWHTGHDLGSGSRTNGGPAPR